MSQHCALGAAGIAGTWAEVSYLGLAMGSQLRPIHAAAAMSLASLLRPPID
jgi:hypothetical protein